MQNHKEKLNLTLSPEVKSKIKEYAREDGRSISAITSRLYKDLISGRRATDSVISVQYLDFYRDGGLGRFGVKVFDSMLVAQAWIKQQYQYNQLDDNLVSCSKNGEGDALDLRIYYEEEPEQIKSMVFIAKQMLVHEVN